MSNYLWIVRRPFGRGQAADAWLARLVGKPVTYDHVGSTLPADHRPATATATATAARPSVRAVSVLVPGAGADGFVRGRDAVRTWRPHHAIGATVHPAAPPAVGADVLVDLRWHGVHITVPDRVVAVIDEPGRYAFAYGTLPGHAEVGEESFLVELLADDAVRVTVTVDARTRRLLVPGAPLVRAIQRWALRRYVDAIARAVRGQSSDGAVRGESSDGAGAVTTSAVV